MCERETETETEREFVKETEAVREIVCEREREREIAHLPAACRARVALHGLHARASRLIIRYFIPHEV